MKIKESDDCLLCNKKDTLFHFFFECSAVSSLWREVKKIILNRTGQSLSLDSNDVMLGIIAKKGIKKQDLCIINRIIMIGKLVISKGKYGKAPNFKTILEQELSLRNLI